MIGRARLPDFELPATGNQRFQLSAFSGHPVVPCFHPGDGTPGCTDEGDHYRALHGELAQAGVPVFAISRDCAASQGKFKRKMSPSVPGVLHHHPAPTRCPTIP
jgi:thioredoxin-dependent peroxiredoxin